MKLFDFDNGPVIDLPFPDYRFSSLVAQPATATEMK